MIRSLYDPEVARKGACKLLLLQLKVLFPNLPLDYEEKIKNSTIEAIEEIALNLLKLNDMSDLDKYLDN